MRTLNSNGVLVNVNTYDYSTYFNDRYSLGAGWSFNFPSVQIEKDYIPYAIGDTYAYDIEENIYYHTGNGSVYQAEFSASNPSNLKRYYKNNVLFERNNTSYSNGQITSYYSFTDSDKTVQYFARDGRLIGIRDRFDNTIQVEHQMKPIANRVPNGGFEYGTDMWNTTSGVNAGVIGKYDDSSLRFNGSNYMYAASSPIQVEPSTAYNITADIFPQYGVSSDVDIQIHLLDAAYQERSVKTIYVPYNLSANQWNDLSDSFTTSTSTRYIFISIVAPYGTSNLYVDNMHVENPKPLISKITDSIGREITFNYQGKIEDENSPNDVILTVKTPNKQTEKTIEYYRMVETFKSVLGGGSGYQARHIWYLESSNTEGESGYPVDYYYGGSTPGAESEELQWRAGIAPSYQASTTIKPVLNIVRYKNHISVYEYEKVRKYLGRYGYHDTLRVSSRYDQYGYTPNGIHIYYGGEKNRVDYRYSGDSNQYIIDNETGYPVSYFDDPDDYTGSPVFFRSTATVSFDENDELTTTDTYSNGKLLTQIISNPRLSQYESNDYEYHSVFKDSIVFNRRHIINDNEDVFTYAGMTYNSWGGLETKTQLLQSDIYFNSEQRAKYTTSYSYHPVYKKVTSAQYYNDADGDLITQAWTYDSLGRLTKSTNAEGEEISYFYGNSLFTGNLTKTEMSYPSNTHYVIDNNMSRTTYSYDQYNAFVASSSSNYQGGISTTSYEYEYIFGNLRRQINPDNDWYEFQYDENGRIRREYSPVAQGDGYPFYFATNYSYPGLYMYPSYTINPTLLFDTVVKNENIYNMTNDTYIRKSASQYLYGSNGEGLVHIQYDFDRPDGSDFEPVITKYRYDQHTRLAEIIDDLGKSTKVKYDAFGRVEELTDNAGSKFVTEYNPAARTQLSYFVPVSAPETSENHIKLQYDAFGNLEEKFAYPNGYDYAPISVKYRYNIAGNLVGHTDPKENEYSYFYDKMGRLTKTVLPDGTSAASSYNKFGSPNFEHQYDENGNTTAGRSTLIDEAGNKKNTFYSYNNLLSHVDSLQSDAMGRVTLKNEGGSTYTMQYDGMSNAKTLSNGSTDINYKYSSHGVRKIIPSDSSVTEIEYGYNGLGRLYGKSQGDESMAYLYTPTGQVERYGDTLGMYIDYYYDNLNRIDSVYALNSDYYFDYNDNGTVDIMFSGPLTTYYAYDNINRVESITTKRNATTINHLTYSYDDNGNIETETINGVTTTYTYDVLNRLKTANYGDDNIITYIYDARGNRTEEIHSTGLTKVYHYDKANRLKSVAENGIITDEYEYNSAGAVVSHNNNSYTYDNWDRLSSATINGTTHTYSYDANGLRTSKNDTQYIVDVNGNVVGELNESNQVTAQNVFIHGKAVSRKIGNKWYFYLKNAHGDVIGMTDNNGYIVNSYSYDAWGNVRQQNETVTNPIKYAGEYYDNELEQYYLRARYYDPKVGRFTSLDIIRGDISNPQVMNRYVYCANNPIMFIDPNGLRLKSYTAEAASVLLQQVIKITGDDRYTFDRNFEIYLEESLESNVVGGSAIGRALVQAAIQSDKDIILNIADKNGDPHNSSTSWHGTVVTLKGYGQGITSDELSAVFVHELTHAVVNAFEYFNYIRYNLLGNDRQFDELMKTYIDTRHGEALAVGAEQQFRNEMNYTDRTTVIGNTENYAQYAHLVSTMPANYMGSGNPTLTTTNYMYVSIINTFGTQFNSFINTIFGY